MQPQIFLNKDHMKIIVDAAKNRRASNNKAGNHSSPNHVEMPAKTSVGSVEERALMNEVVGLCGEMAVSMFLCIQIPSLVFDQKYFSENKHKIRDVGSYEVKSTVYSSGKLILQKKHMKKSNAKTKYILCTVNLSEDLQSAVVTIRGWSTPELVKLNGELVESLYNESWRLSQEKLNPIETLTLVSNEEVSHVG